MCVSLRFGQNSLAEPTSGTKWRENVQINVSEYKQMLHAAIIRCRLDAKVFATLQEIITEFMRVFYC